PKSKLPYYYQLELKRQKNTLNLIASENYPSQKILFYSGSVLMAKYSEGYPGKRYYQGCQYIDKIEELAINRVKKIFGAEYANVQPHSGAQANQAVYLALLKPGDKILSLNLLSGGHLTHGAKVNFSGTFYQVHYYNLDPHTHQLDYQQIRKIAHQVQPKLIITGYSSYSLKIDFAEFGKIAQEVGAYLLADIAHVVGLVVAKLFPNPFPYADVITFTTHKTLRGPRGAVISAHKKFGGLIDRAVFPGNQGGPAPNIIAAKAECFQEATQPEFKKYQQKVLENAKTMADFFLEKGVKVISGGTETHLLTIDTKLSYNLTGKEAAESLEKAGIICNKQMIPYDTEKPSVGSGIRFGSPALTTRGLGRIILLIGYFLPEEIIYSTIKRELEKRVEKSWQKLNAALKNISDSTINPSDPEKLRLEKVIIESRKQIENYKKEMKEGRGITSLENKHLNECIELKNNNLEFFRKKLQQVDQRGEEEMEAGSYFFLVWLKNIDKITSSELKNELLKMVDPTKNTDLGEYKREIRYGQKTYLIKKKINFSKFILVATTSTTNPKLSDEKCTQVVEGASLESWCMLNSIPEEVETYSWKGKKFLVVGFEKGFSFVNGPFRFLLVPDDNSELVKQIKTGSAGGRKKYYRQFLLIKDTEEIKKVEAEPLPSLITFKVISQKKTTAERSENPSDYNHELEIEPLYLGMEGLPPITRLIFEFFDDINPSSTSPRLLKNSKIYNSDILTKSAGKNFTMKVKN
ncbi:2660_t:CDS:2, partial [Funneliformis geosporum]